MERQDMAFGKGIGQHEDCPEGIGIIIHTAKKLGIISIL
jgi:hypothetical protein